MVLVEKDFLSFGHMFAKRSGHLSNEKFFIDRYVQPTPPVISDDPPASGRSSPSITSPATVVQSTPSPSSSAAAAAIGAFANMTSRISLKSSTSKPPQMKETSPVFHQFLDSVYQLLYLHPNRFQFNERFLRRLLYHAYSCQYGSFLYDSEKERVEAKVRKRTRCIWDYFLARRKEFWNTEFDGSLDEGEGVLFPKGDSVRWWAQAWGRTDAEMNGPGRGTNVRDEITKIKEDKQERDRAEALRERVERAVRNTSPRKDLQLFDGVGSSPSRTMENASGEESPTRVRPTLPREVLKDQEPFVEVDPSVGKGDPATDEEVAPEIIERTIIESSDHTSLGGSAIVISNTIEDNAMSEFLSDAELDPLGGGVEMTSLSINNRRKR
jgi:hypothetical protein